MPDQALGANEAIIPEPKPVSLDWSAVSDQDAAAAMASALKSGRTPDQLQSLVMQAMDLNAAEAEDAKALPLFPAMSPEDFDKHLAIMTDGGGRLQYEQVLKDLYQTIVDVATSKDQQAYQRAAFALLKTIRRNAPHLEEFLATQLSAAKDLPASMAPAVDAAKTVLKMLGKAA